MMIEKAKRIIKFIVRFPNIQCNKILMKVHRIRFGKNFTPRGIIKVFNHGLISFGNNCIINGDIKYNPIGYRGCILTAENNARIIVGDHVGLSNCTIYAKKSVVIGDNTLIGGGAKIYDTDFHSLDAKYRNTKEDSLHTKTSQINIGNNVFIGAGAFILKGVSIGDCSIIGAGAVVSKDIPAGEIWAGNPAVSIKKISE